MRRNFLALAGGLALLASACSNTPTDSTADSLDNATITADAATVAADGFGEDVDMITGMDGSVGNLVADDMGSDFKGRNGYRPGLTGCSFADGMFTCPAVTRNGLTVTRTITLLDSTGTAQATYDSLTTASIHVVADLSGSPTHGGWTATVSRHRDFTVTGLLGSETTRTVNGTGNETVSRSHVNRNDSTRSYDITGNSTITDVVMPVSATTGGNGYPVSGSITRIMTITLTSGPHSGRTVTRTVTITFNGSASASASVDGSTFTIDLPDHTAAPGH
ncbi:MAG TPA: hypothetical protein VGM77_05345 [Gemmatimonadales bacterium]|jgi:hypothetical protein